MTNEQKLKYYKIKEICETRRTEFTHQINKLEEAMCRRIEQDRPYEDLEAQQNGLIGLRQICDEILANKNIIIFLAKQK